MYYAYAAGALHIELPQFFVKHSRLWALFDNFSAAEQTVLTNYGDFFESSYNYALIEEVCINDHMSLYTPPPKQWWYKADFDGHNVWVVKTEIPFEFKNISNWWVG